MKRSSLKTGNEPLFFRICPKCYRAMPKASNERYCINDGTRLLEHCQHCKANITSPYARFCANCGLGFTSLAPETTSQPKQPKRKQARD